MKKTSLTLVIRRLFAFAVALDAGNQEEISSGVGRHIVYG